MCCSSLAVIELKSYCCALKQICTVHFVAIGGSKPLTRFGVLTEGISVFIRRTLFACKGMFPSDMFVGKKFPFDELLRI